MTWWQKWLTRTGDRILDAVGEWLSRPAQKRDHKRTGRTSRYPVWYRWRNKVTRKKDAN